MIRYKDKERIKKKILNNIIDLFKEAKIQFKKNPKLSDRYVSLARKAAMKIKLKLPRSIKRKFCKYCYKYLVPSVNARVRLNNNRVTYYCNSCKKYTRFMLNKKN